MGEAILTILVLSALGAAARSAAVVNDGWLSIENGKKASTWYLEKHGPPNTHKFWTVSIIGAEVHLAWGRIGGFGLSPWKRATSLMFETPTLARKAALCRLKVKLRNGYTVRKGGAE